MAASVNNNEDGITFEDALGRTKSGKFFYALMFVSGVFIASNFYETMSVMYALPVAECDLKITSKTQYGIVSGVWFAGIILTSLFWGFLADAFGRRNILIISALSAFLATILSSLAQNLWQLALFRFMNGMCISGTISTIFAYLGEFFATKNRSRFVMFSTVINALLCMCLPLIAWLVINQNWSFHVPLIEITFKPWRLFLLVCGMPSCLCGLVMFAFPESPKFTFSQGDETRTLKILSEIYWWNTGSKDFPVKSIKPDEEFTVNASDRKNIARRMWSQTVLLFRKYPRSTGIVAGLQFTVYFVYNGMLLFFPDILNQTAKYQESSPSSQIQMCQIVEDAIRSKTLDFNQTLVRTSQQICIDELDISAYYYGIVLTGCYTLGYLTIGILVNYIGRISIFAFIFSTTGICGIAITFISNPSIATYLFVWMLICGTNNITLNTVTYDLFPTSLRSMAMSISILTGRLGALIGGNVAGYLLERDCNVSFTICGVLLLLSCGVSFLIPNILRRK